MGNSSAKYSPYVRTVVFQFPQQSSTFRRDTGLCQEFSTSIVTPPAVLHQEFNISLDTVSSGIVSQEFTTALTASGQLWQEYTLDTISIPVSLAQELTVSGITDFQTLSQEFSTTLEATNSLRQEFLTNFTYSGNLQQEFTISGIVSSCVLRQEFTNITSQDATRDIQQEFFAQIEVSGFLSQEFGISIPNSGILCQNFNITGPFTTSCNLGQEFDIDTVTVCEILRQEFTVPMPRTSILGQEFSEAVETTDYLSQEFATYYHGTLGQQFRVPVSQNPDPGTFIDGNVQLVHLAPTLYLSGLTIEGDKPGHEPSAGHSGVNISISQLDADMPLDTIEFMLGHNDATMPLRYKTNQWFSSEARSHRFALMSKLHAGDQLYFGVAAYTDIKADIIQFIPPITASGQLTNTYKIGGRSSLPKLVPISLGRVNRLPKLIALMAGETSTQVEGVHVTMNETSKQLTPECDINICKPGDWPSDIPATDFSPNGIAVGQFKQHNSMGRLVFLQGIDIGIGIGGGEGGYGTPSIDGDVETSDLNDTVCRFENTFTVNIV